ncbi:MAG: hypothetical protein ACK4SV_07920, partial [Hyphomonas sp.]
MERRLDRGESVSKHLPDDLSTFSQLIDLHITDMLDVGAALRRSKAYSPEKLRARPSHVPLEVLDRERIIQFARERQAEGAGPPTISADISRIKTVLLHASAVHGLPVSPEQVDLARVALKRLGLVGKAQERDRRPTQEELDLLIGYFNGNSRQKSPIGRLVIFAVATAMRHDPAPGIPAMNLQTLSISALRPKSGPLPARVFRPFSHWRTGDASMIDQRRRGFVPDGA